MFLFLVTLVANSLEFLLQIKRRGSFTLKLLQPLLLALEQLLAFSIIWISGTCHLQFGNCLLGLDQL